MKKEVQQYTGVNLKQLGEVQEKSALKNKMPIRRHLTCNFEEYNWSQNPAAIEYNKKNVFFMDEADDTKDQEAKDDKSTEKPRQLKL